MRYEKQFGCTIVHGISVEELVQGVSCPPLGDADVERVLQIKYDTSIIDAPWRLPAGAFGFGGCGAS